MYWTERHKAFLTSRSESGIRKEYTQLRSKTQQDHSHERELENSKPEDEQQWGDYEDVRVINEDAFLIESKAKHHLWNGFMSKFVEAGGAE